jgi:glycine cleavage system pyridoxal-binding protein P
VSRSFEDRHIGPTHSDEKAMLDALGYSDLNAFITDVVPSNIAINGTIEASIGAGKSEVEVISNCVLSHQKIKSSDHLSVPVITEQSFRQS